MLVKNYLRPKTLEEAYNSLVEDKKNMIIAGGAWIKLSYKNVETLISLEDLELSGISNSKEYLEIGAMTSLRELEISKEVGKLYDGVLSKAIHQIMGVSIRNLATIGGCIMGKFPFSDIFPALLVMDTKLVFYKQGEISLKEYLEKPKMEKDILVKIMIKNEEGKAFFKKVATTPLDFSIINCAVSRNSDGFKICLGSTPYLAKLAEKAMEYINLQDHFDEDVINHVVKLAIEEIKFGKNVRSSKEYKEELAKVYIKRGIKKVIANVG